MSRLDDPVIYMLTLVGVAVGTLIMLGGIFGCGRTFIRRGKMTTMLAYSLLFIAGVIVFGLSLQSPSLVVIAGFLMLIDLAFYRQGEQTEPDQTTGL
jgi:hypothetical protein